MPYMKLVGPFFLLIFFPGIFFVATFHSPTVADTVSTEGKLPPLDIKYRLRGYFHAGTNITGTGGGYAPSDNKPTVMPEDLRRQVTTLRLIAKPEEEVPFIAKSVDKGLYRGMEVRLQNGTSRTVAMEASDSRLYIVMEARDRDGEFKPIEVLPSSWCGNSFHEVFLSPQEEWRFVAPIYTGTFQTTLRFTLVKGKERPLVSNEFEGAINPEQFTVDDREQSESW